VLQVYRVGFDQTFYVKLGHSYDEDMLKISKRYLKLLRYGHTERETCQLNIILVAKVKLSKKKEN
jgi:hypothetical protein